MEALGRLYASLGKRHGKVVHEEMVEGSRLKMVVTLEGLLNIPIPCFDIFEGTLLGSWCQQDFSEIITVTIFVQ